MWDPSSGNALNLGPYLPLKMTSSVRRKITDLKRPPTTQGKSPTSHYMYRTGMEQFQQQELCAIAGSFPRVIFYALPTFFPGDFVGYFRRNRFGRWWFRDFQLKNDFGSFSVSYQPSFRPVDVLCPIVSALPSSSWIGSFQITTQKNHVSSYARKSRAK
jgi:hypothetical protein